MPSQNGSKRSLIPTQVKWDAAGVKVEGVLLSKEDTMYQDNVRGRYMIQSADGLKVVLGGFQIDQALGMVGEGAYVGIEYLGEEGTGRGMKMKMFDIWVDDGIDIQASLNESQKQQKEEEEALAK